MSLYIRLDKQINQKELLKKIQHEINEHRKSNSLEDSILCIDIKPVTFVGEKMVKTKVSAYLEGKQ